MAKIKKPLKKKAPVKKVVAKKSAGKKTPAKKVIKKAAPKKAVKPAKKIPAKKIVAKKPVAKKQLAPKQPKGPYGLPEQLRDAALKVLDERQADDIVTVNLAGRSAMADYMIIASGRAAKQLGAIAQYLREEFTKLGAGQMRVEGIAEGNWVLMDAGDVIVHLFRPEVRRYYNLEQIWDRSSPRSGRGSDVSARDE